MLEHYLGYFENTIKGMAESDEGWALQPIIPRIKDATLETLAFYIKSITSTLGAHESLPPRKRDQDGEGLEAPAEVGPLKGHKGTPFSLVPTASEMLTRDRRPKKRTV